MGIFLKLIGSKIKSMFSKASISNFFDSAEKHLAMITNKFGMGKLLHFFVGAFAVAIVSSLNAYWVIGMAIVISVASYVKERFIDDVFDKKDLNASILGAVIATLIYFLMK